MESDVRKEYSDDDEETSGLLGKQKNDEQTHPLVADGNQAVLYAKRWFILLVYGANNMMTGMLFVALSGINNTASRYYKVPSESIELLTTIPMLGFIFCALPSCYAMKRWGIRPLLITGSTLQFATTILQYFAHHQHNFWLLILGQCIAAVASATILQVAPRLSTTWFPESQRATATGVGVAANVLGSSLGFIHSTLVVKWSDDKEMVDKELGKFFLVRLVLCLLVNILTFAYEETPPTPPHTCSPRATVPFCESLSRLRGNIDFVLVAVSVGTYYGLYCTVSPLVDPIMTERYESGYEWMIAVMGFCSQLFAVVSFIVVARCVDVFNRYKLISVILLFTTFIVWLVFFIVLTNTDMFVFLFVLYIFYGLLVCPC